MMDQPDSSQRWLAYELHDGLLQWVIASHMQLQAALGRLPEGELRLRAPLEMALSNLRTAADEGRELIAFLEQQRPASGARLAARLADFVDSIDDDAKLSQQSIRTAIDLEAGQELSDAVSWNMLRIAQQALRNAIRHAGPARLQVILSRTHAPETVVLSVQDDGCGFAPAQALALTNHFGLQSMQHRAKLIGADLQIKSAPNTGTQIQLTFPLPH